MIRRQPDWLDVDLLDLIFGPKLEKKGKIYCFRCAVKSSLATHDMFTVCKIQNVSYLDFCMFYPVENGSFSDFIYSVLNKNRCFKILNFSTFKIWTPLTNDSHGGILSRKITRSTLNDYVTLGHQSNVSCYLDGVGRVLASLSCCGPPKCWSSPVTKRLRKSLFIWLCSHTLDLPQRSNRLLTTELQLCHIITDVKWYIYSTFLPYSTTQSTLYNLNMFIHTYM